MLLHSKLANQAAQVNPIEINKIIHRLNLINFSISFKKLELPNSGELQREDYLPLKLPPLPSIDSAVESWVSGASNSRASNNNNFNGNNNNDSPPIYTAGT